VNKKNVAITLLTSATLTSAVLVSVALADGPRHMRGHFFEKMDANKDGKVTLVEAKSAAQARFASIDANKDGRLTTQEIEAHHAAKHAERAKKHPQKNGDKREGWHQKRKERGAKFFAKLDANGDGAIDASESVAKAEKMFARMDANNDGAVTKDELGRRGGKDCGHKRGGKHRHEGAAGSGPQE